jgi:hypothetical protein
MEERIVCFCCGKLFAKKLRGNIIVTPSTAIEFEIEEEGTVIELLCRGCKSRTTLILE